MDASRMDGYFRVLDGYFRVWDGLPRCPPNHRVKKCVFFVKKAPNRILVLHGFIQDVVRKYFPPFNGNGNLFTVSQVLGYLSKTTFTP